MSEAPIVIAHRAGNDAATLVAVQGDCDAIELDVHLARGGRLEVRHAKRVWPTRRLWERWYLLPRGSDVPDLADIVAAADPDTVLWFDLKGVSPRIAGRLRPYLETRTASFVSTKSWWLLQRLRGVPGVTTVRSAGNRWELALLCHLPSRVRPDGAVIRRDLLDEAVVRRLRARGRLYTWRVRSTAQIDQLTARGWVDGVILDDVGLARRRERS